MRHYYPAPRARIGPAPVATGERTAVLEGVRGRKFSGFDSRTGGAATYAYLQLYNPADSERLVLVEQVAMSSTSLAAPALSRNGAALSNLTGSGFDHSPGRLASHAELRWEEAGVLSVDLLFQQELAVNTPLVLRDLGLWLRPGEGAVASAASVNIPLTVAWQWREFPLDVWPAIGLG